jgi:hypothetical protein
MIGLGVSMLKEAKSNHNHYLILCFLHQMFFKIIVS